MASITDPARELSEIAARFPVGPSLRADQIIQQQIGFEPWSSDFFRLILCIQERADTIARVLPRSPLDPDLIEQALIDVAAFKNAFTPQAIRLTSNQTGSTAVLMKEHGRAMQYLSPVIREMENYPRYTAEELSEFVDLIDRYLAEINDSDETPYFVRRAIADGLSVLRFRLNNVGWLGSGYALHSLKEAMELYQRASTDSGVAGNPDAEAFVNGFGAILARVVSVIKGAKEYGEAAGAVWSGYQITSTALTTYMIGSSILAK